ncbi:hypothetical protein CLV28_0101 [Sediminihabitans luteus]|uniref:Uncharacterized protein n=1 Tax=Sediminihabitans luteus TaxID=1138585 RepID=A0A2M9CYB4_9CELL|nr:hypothetical protein [Sediminihabitans luteus]PJJ76890.1 hypothetical protein CLV28_0101 [Sediminihabitans luteus]GII99531.1 hypothetical protein Slu03_19090 [Sediminihabitans luteus]
MPTTPVPDGWKGGFSTSDPAFEYPDPDLSSLRLLDNMANIDRLTRQQAVLWPEFSWQTVRGDEASRCFQMFAPDISRLGYDDAGRVWSIICPQQGTCSPTVGALNVEVSVTGQRGWVDEPSRARAADLTVEGKVWFSPSATASPLVAVLWRLFADNGLPFPASKEHAIRVSTHRVGVPDDAAFSLRDGLSPDFTNPTFALHDVEAWAVGNLSVQIGAVRPSGDAVVDEFNALVIDAFNLWTGNLLREGNVLTWNVWFNQPELVCVKEWKDHAERWRRSIDADHGSPDGDGTPARYFNGRPFAADVAAEAAEREAIVRFLDRHLALGRD